MQYWVGSTFPQAALDAGVLLEDDALREGIYFPAGVAIGPTKWARQVGAHYTVHYTESAKSCVRFLLAFTALCTN